MTAVPDSGSEPESFDSFSPFRCFASFIDPTHAAVLVTGELDLGTAPLLRAKLDEVLARPVQRITVDVGDVTFMDSSGLGALLTAHAKATQACVTLRLERVSRQVRLVIESSGLAETFRLRPLEA